MLPIGQFVYVEESLQKVGKCVDVCRNTATVEWFFSPLHQESQQLPIGKVRAYLAPQQSRCFYRNRDAGCWEAGRIWEWISPTLVEVRFPNDKVMPLPLDDVFLRCHIGEVDQMALMHNRIWESPIFHTMREPLIEELVRQEAATHALSALLSARVRLFDHQLDVVRRVLEDPTQRYLLADEVGLGKTIEAAIILRQTLLDCPQARVLLVVPAHLRQQWQTELQEKVQITSADYAVQFASHDDLGSPHFETTTAKKPWDFVIVDEAHHLARGAFVTQGAAESKAWEHTRILCHAAPRVLLLSATPALHNEDDFLAMLHLLEPHTYPLMGRAAFRRKIEGRTGVAAALDTVQENITTPLELGEAADALREHLSDDAWILSKADQFDGLRKQLRSQPESVTPDEIVRLVRETRLHICETHRVHRRMLRSSRQRIPAGVLPNQAGGRVTPEWLCGALCDAVQSGLDAWREQAIFEKATSRDYQQVFRVFLSLSTSWTPLIMEGLCLRLGLLKHVHLLPPSDAAILKSTPLFGDERAILENWLRDLERATEEKDETDDALMHLAALLAQHRGGRKIIFTAYSSAADAIKQSLSTTIHPRYLYLHTKKMDVAERQAALARFQNEIASAVLICDASGEEGLNLQFVDRVIFFDLPWEPNRLEQRIGRVNRIGGPETMVPLHILLHETTPTGFGEAYYKLLENGVKIFDASVADLQFYLERVVPQWVETALEEGAKALKNKAASTGEAVQKERRTLRQQADLDTLEAYSTDDRDFAQSLREADDDKQQEHFASVLHNWLSEGVQLAYYGSPRRYRHTHRTLLPQDVWNQIDAPCSYFSSGDKGLKRLPTPSVLRM